MSIKNRRSPSGPIADALLPIYGADVLTASLTRYFQLGSVAAPTATEPLGQAAPSEGGILRRVVIQNVKLGVTPSAPTTLDVVTYNVRKNAAPITGATGTLNNFDPDPLEIEVNAPILGPDVGVAADLISVEVVTLAFTGTSPVVRAWVIWAPGASF